MDLNTILIILGVIALIGLVAHGIWSNRRENSQLFKNSKFERQNANNMQEPEPIKPQQQNIPNFAQPSIQATQATQTIQTTQAVQIEQVEQVQQVQFPQTAQPQTAQNDTAVFTHSANSAHSVEQIKITLPENQPKETADKPVFYEYKPEPKPLPENVLERTLADVTEFAGTEEGINMNSEQIRVQLQDAVTSDVTPVVAPMASPMSKPKLQQPINFAETANHTANKTANSEDDVQHSFNFDTDDRATSAVKFLLLYVVAPENRRFQGVSLLQTLEHLGFVFGKNAQYHRHVDSVGSPVIFSVANIEQNGAFNPYAVQDFSTVGVALFMSLPSQVGNDKANFKMMVKAAKDIAQELSGFVLTDQEELFDDVAEQRYLSQL